jgi:hypothetical protein
MRRIALLTLLISCMCSLNLWSQNVSSAVQGTVVDSTNAVVVGAQVLVVNQNTATERNVVTSEKGLFRVPQLLPGTYKVTIKAQGFKAYTQKDVVLVGSETRDLGNIKLDVGSATEQVEVNAEVTPVQTASSEKASTIDPEEMKNQTIRGRDMVAYMDMIPGLVDAPGSASRAGGNADRNVSSTEALSGITLNGADSWHINYTVDGVPVMDNSNQKLHYEPNVDSIQELKVMSSSYQAEFGRNSGGTITIVTKGGGNKFHGSGWYAHKHDDLNATDWATKEKTKNRSNVAGWSLGGPVYIPGKFNTQKNKLFFFASQEYTRQLVPSQQTTQDYTFPTSEVASGDFTNVYAFNSSRNQYAPEEIYYNNNGVRTLIPGCDVDRSLGTCNISAYADATGTGPKILQWFNTTAGSNFTSYTGNNAYLYNWHTPIVSGTHPRRNDMIRVDTNVTSNLSAYFRWIQDTDTQIKHQMQGTADIYPTEEQNSGHGYVGSATWTINPTTVNELTVGYDWTEDNWLATKTNDGSLSNIGLNAINWAYSVPFSSVTPDIMPDFYFTSSIMNGPPGMGGGPGGGNCTSAPCNPSKWAPFRWGQVETQHYWTVSDNLSKTIHAHNLKTGFYVEDEKKIKPGAQYYNGEFAFGGGTNQSYDSGDGYANAYMGYVSEFTQASGRTLTHVDYWNIEWYAQDNWRVNNRLTLDAGVRFYHYTPYVDDMRTVSVFDSGKFDYNAVPAFNSQDGSLTCTGGGSNCAGASGIADGYYSNGMVVPGTNGLKLNAYSTKWLAVAPRLGFAMDLFGNGKTAVRGGFGLFYNRESGQLYGAGGQYSMAGQAPILKNADLSNTTISALSTMAKPVTAVTLTNWIGKSNLSDVLNASFGVQQNLGHSFVLDLSYVGAWSENQPGTNSYNINAVPLWSCFSCMGFSGSDPTMNYNMNRPYAGYKDIYMQQFNLYNNYHSLQGTVQRRFSGGLMVGLAYTLSRQLGLSQVDTLLSTQENKAINYGGGPASQNLMVNYSYTVPSLSKKLGDAVGAKLVGAVTDHWTVSGITHFQSGGAYLVSCGATTNPGVNYNPTGTPNEATSCKRIGNPNSGRGVLQFNPAAFTVADYHSLGNSNQTYMVGPGVNNWDLTLRRSIPMGSESRRKIILEASGYNIFNHPQFTSVNSRLSFSCSDGSIVNNNECSGTWKLDDSQVSTTGKPDQSAAGVYGISTQQQRMFGLNARIEF